MAYGLKYTSGNISRNGINWVLKIHQKDYSGSALIIGDMQGLVLEVQGGSDPVDAPIIKTSLTFTLADSRDKSAAGYKYGAWEEFYTPDSTKYKVELLRGSTVMWTGFVTPDSWSDDLKYRGSVTITARDNIGHIADFDFSASDITTGVVDGMADIRTLITTAFRIAGVAMTFDYSTAEQYHPHIVIDGYAQSEWLIDLANFEGKTWYEAIENVLASAGLCLRYHDNNTIFLEPIRSLYLQGKNTASGLTSVTANFINRSGHRQLDPAYRQITEELQYEALDGKLFEWGFVDDWDDWFPAKGDFTLYNGTGYYQSASVLTAVSGWTQSEYQHEVFRPTTKALLNYYKDISGDTDKYMLLASMPYQIASAARFNYMNAGTYCQYVRRLAPNTLINVSFELAHLYNDYGTAVAHERMASGALRYAVLWRTLDNTYYSLGNMGWDAGSAARTDLIDADDDYTETVFGVTYKGYASGGSVTISHDVVTPDEPGELILRFFAFTHNIQRESNGTSSSVQIGYHIRLGNISVNINSEGIPSKFSIKTIYNTTYNYTLKRDVDYGFVPKKFTTAGTIKNGFYLPDQDGHAAVADASWSNENTTLPLPVLNHLQILSMHAKPNNVLTGELRAASGASPRFDYKWLYDSRNFILQSGKLNVFTGIIEDATLREYDTYESAIGEASANYTSGLTGGNLQTISMQKSISAAGQTTAVYGGGTVPTGVTYAQLPDKPSINGTTLSGNVLSSSLGISYNDLDDRPAIPEAQVQSDWAESDSAAKSFIKNKPNILDVVIVASDERVDSAKYAGYVAALAAKKPFYVKSKYYQASSGYDAIYPASARYDSDESSIWLTYIVNSHVHEVEIVSGEDANDIEIYDLSNYYTKNNTYNKTEVNTLIGSVAKMPDSLVNSFLLEEDEELLTGGTEITTNELFLTWVEISGPFTVDGEDLNEPEGMDEIHWYFDHLGLNTNQMSNLNGFNHNLIVHSSMQYGQFYINASELYGALVDGEYTFDMETYIYVYDAPIFTDEHVMGLVYHAKHPDITVYNGWTENGVTKNYGNVIRYLNGQRCQFVPYNGLSQIKCIIGKTATPGTNNWPLCFGIPYNYEGSSGMFIPQPKSSTTVRKASTFVHGPDYISEIN